MYKKICITNRKLVRGDFLEQLEKVTQDGVDAVILREKDLPMSEYERLAEKVLALCARNHTLCILHGYKETAKRLNHPYIHLPMPLFLELREEEKQYFKMIGVSTHTVEEAKTAAQKGAHYITASHIFPTECKDGLPPRGLQYLKEAADAVDIPVYALGGIHPDNAQLCIDAGADGVCMMSEYMKSESKERNACELDRYKRQIILPEVGMDGQNKLKKARVLIIGAGGLGSPAALYLAGAGIGTIGIADADTVSLSNLHRQILHTTAGIGLNKAASAKENLRKRNDMVQIIPYPYCVTPENIDEIIRDYDFIIDGVDNFETKFLINDACVIRRKPFCHAGVLRFQGQVMTYVPGQGPCYRCIFEEIPEHGSIPNCSQTGIIGAAAGVIGSIQALEAIKYILSAGELLTGKMYLFDGLTMKSRIAKFPCPSETCRVCGPRKNILDVKQNHEEYEAI